MSKTKQAQCVECGKDIKIHIYASPKTCKCEDCKLGGMSNSEQEDYNNINMSGPRIDRQPNKALQTLGCPHHPDHPMKLVGVIHSPMWGDIISMQCRQPGCWLVVNISEQSKNAGPLRTRGHGDGYEVDLTADEIKDKLASGEIHQDWLDHVIKHEGAND